MVSGEFVLFFLLIFPTFVHVPMHGHCRFFPVRILVGVGFMFRPEVLARLCESNLENFEVTYLRTYHVP